MVVRGMPDVRTDLAALRKLPIDLPLGGQAPLTDVADVYIEPAPNEIKREAASRRLDVTCNVAGPRFGLRRPRDRGAGRQAATSNREYHPEFLGEYAARQESSRRLLALSLLSLARHSAALAHGLSLLAADRFWSS